MVKVLHTMETILFDFAPTILKLGEPRRSAILETGPQASAIQLSQRA